MSAFPAILGPSVGHLVEPLSGRRWDPTAIARWCARRIVYYRSHGLGPGDRVFMHLGNTPGFFVDLLAIWHLGGCAVPLDPRWTPFEVETLGRWARPRFSLWGATSDATAIAALTPLGVLPLEGSEADLGRGRADAVAAPPGGLEPDRDALILFTSGTTGQPKGVIHTHRSLRARWMSLRQSLGLTAFRRTLCLLPTNFGHGLICNALFPWLFGQDLFVGPAFKTDVVTKLGALIDDHEITFMSSVPSLWRLALKTARPPRTPSLHRVVCGSAPLSASLWSSIQSWTGTREVMNAYGITETASWVAGTTMPDFAVEDGLIGEPWGVEVKVSRSGSVTAPRGVDAQCAPGEPGYIWVSTPGLMRGYLGRDDLTAEVVSRGWFSTRDLGYLDDRGLLYLRGREREEINKGGTKVYPSDVDAVVERFPATIDVCSFGYAEPLLGENVGVAVVVNPASIETLRDLHEWARRHLATHQMPARWYVLEEIPRTSRGKVDRATVAERCAALTPVDFAPDRGSSGTGSSTPRSLGGGMPRTPPAR